MCFVCVSVCMYVWLHVTLHVYKTSGVLIIASHLPHISTLSLCICLLSYVRCGFSTSPVVRSQPQIRAVYPTTVASSSAYKHILFLPLCLFFKTCFLSCWRNRKCRAECVVLSCFSSLTVVFPLQICAKGWWCLGWCALTHPSPASTCTHSHTDRGICCMHALTSNLTNSRKQIQRERCMSGILLPNPHRSVWHGKIYTTIQFFKKAKATGY